MCGRYEFSLGVAPLLDRVAAQEEDWQPGEVRPGMDAPVLIARGGKIGVQMQNWGFGARGTENDQRTGRDRA